MRKLLLVLIALACAACTRLVVLDPPPDGSSELPDAFHAHDGGTDGVVQDAGGSPDSGVIGDAAFGG